MAIGFICPVYAPMDAQRRNADMMKSALLLHHCLPSFLSEGYRWTIVSILNRATAICTAFVSLYI